MQNEQKNGASSNIARCHANLSIYVLEPIRTSFAMNRCVMQRRNDLFVFVCKKREKNCFRRHRPTVSLCCSITLARSSVAVAVELGIILYIINLRDFQCFSSALFSHSLQFMYFLCDLHQMLIGINLSVYTFLENFSVKKLTPFNVFVAKNYDFLKIRLLISLEKIFTLENIHFQIN